MQFNRGSAAVSVAVLGVAPRNSAREERLLVSDRNGARELVSGTLTRARETRTLPNPNRIMRLSETIALTPRMEKGDQHDHPEDHSELPSRRLNAL